MNIFSQAEAIRQALDELGDSASFKKLAERVKEFGVESISPQQVSNEKRFRRQRPNLDDLPISVIKKVKRLVDELGSVAIVRRALDELDKIQYDNR